MKFLPLFVVLAALVAVPAHATGKKRPTPPSQPPAALAGVDGPDTDLLAPYGGHNLDLDFVPLRFTNRAQCALDSKTPTHSTFVLIDGYDAGKLGHNLALATGQDPAELTAQAMTAFRLTVAEMMSKIVADLIKGRLPLLPAGDDAADHFPAKYAQLLAQCRNGEYCAALDPYLSSVWENAQAAPQARAPWASLDTFGPEHFYFATGNERIGCHYLKRFSPLESHLDSTAPDGSVLAQVAQAALSYSDLITHCLNPSPKLAARFASVQLDLLNMVDDKSWNPKLGFDFWNSVKIYFSWGWRNLPRLSRYSEPFDFAFRSIPVEEAVMLMPNGCESIERPACDARYLSVNSLRDFGRAMSPGDSDASLLVPEGADRVLLKNPEVGVNDNELQEHGADAQEWLKGLRSRMIAVRGSMKRRFLSAVTTMNLLVENIAPAEIESQVKTFLATPPAPRDPHYQQWKNQLYYLCSEFTLAHHATMSTMRVDLELLAKTSVLDGLAGQFTQDSVAKLYQYYNDVADRVMPICASLENTDMWATGRFVSDPRGFSPWYREATHQPDDGNDPNAAPPEPFHQGEPLLTYKAYEFDWSPDHVICYSGVDCARRALRAVVDLTAVTNYADAYLPVSENLQAPDAFNPYAERTACKIYDPWFKTRASVKTLLGDLANAAAFGWNMVPAYVDVSVRPAEVTSFDRLVQDGKIRYNPEIKKEKIQLALLADLGPLTGVPCVISISGPMNQPIPFYAFDGLSVGACVGGDKHQLVVKNASDMNQGKDRGGHGCLSCYLNLKTLTNAGAYLPPPYNYAVKTGVYLLAAGIRFYKNMSDSVNVPHSKQVRVDYVVETYVRNGGNIPKHCVGRLSKGHRCLHGSDEEQLAQMLEDRYGGFIQELKPLKDGQPDGTFEVKMSNCADKQVVRAARSGAQIVSGPLACDGVTRSAVQ